MDHRENREAIRMLVERYTQSTRSAAIGAVRMYSTKYSWFPFDKPALIHNPHVDVVYFGDASGIGDTDDVAYVVLNTPAWRGFVPHSGDNVERLGSELAFRALPVIAEGVLARQERG